MEEGNGIEGAKVPEKERIKLGNRKLVLDVDFKYRSFQDNMVLAWIDYIGLQNQIESSEVGPLFT